LHLARVASLDRAREFALATIPRRATDRGTLVARLLDLFIRAGLAIDATARKREQSDARSKPELEDAPQAVRHGSF